MTRTAHASLLVLVLVTASSGGPREDRQAYRALFDPVEIRHGVRHRSLVLLPIVLREGVEPTDGPVLARDRVTWVPLGDPSRTDTVTLTRAATADGETESSVFLPAGWLLGGDGRERLLSRPVLLTPGVPVHVRARFCDAIETPLREPPVEERRQGPAAPPEQRRFDLLLRDPEALGDVQRIQAILAELPEDARTVSDVLDAAALKERVEAATSALAALPRSHGGATVGHLALLGHRPVEVVLTASPETYRSLARTWLKGLAVSLVLWEVYMGHGGPDRVEVDWKLELPAARTAFARLTEDAVSLRAWRRGRREKGGGRTLLVRGPTPPRSATDPSRLVGRLLMSTETRALLLEAYPSGARRLFPSALLAPGGRPSDALPDIRSGTMTMKYLRRLLDRLSARGR